MLAVTTKNVKQNARNEHRQYSAIACRAKGRWFLCHAVSLTSMRKGCS